MITIMKVIINNIEYVPRPTVDPPTDTEIAALNVRFDSDAGEDISIRDYLFILFSTLWQKKEEFNGKRPFGNSSWEYELFNPLVINGFITGEFSIEDDWVEVADKKEATNFVSRLIRAVFYGYTSN
jgi:hypothetical protein